MLTTTLKQKINELLQNSANEASPTYIAALDADGNEIDRQDVVLNNSDATSSEFLALFATGQGVGEWHQINVYHGDAVKTWLSHCDSLTGWLSDRVLSVETTDYQEGSGAVEADGSGSDGTRVFENTSLSVSQDATHVKFYYYTSSAADTGTVTIELGCGGYADEYKWTFTPNNGWNWYSLAFADATVIGSPSITNIDRVKFTDNPPNSTVERIDGLHLWKDGGILLATYTFDIPEVKQVNETKSVYVQWKVQ